MVIKDVEREDIPFVAKTVGAIPISHIDHMTLDKLGKAGLIEEQVLGDDSKIVKVTGVNPDVKTMSIFVRGTNSLVVEEADRSIHDALCVVRSLVKRKGMLVGGGAPEIEVS
jgi:T-complex protein 1 subunit delta